jgi:hypothetical protein
MQVDSKDKEVMERLHEMFGVGTLRQRTRSDGREHVAWTVTGKESLEQFRDVIDEHGGELWEATEKYHNYEVWSEALDIYLDGQTGNDQQIAIARLAKDLNASFGDGWDEFIEIREQRA